MKSNGKGLWISTLSLQTYITHICTYVGGGRGGGGEGEKEKGEEEEEEE